MVIQTEGDILKFAAFFARFFQPKQSSPQRIFNQSWYLKKKHLLKKH